MSFPNGATRAFYRVLLLVEHITQKDTAEPSYHYERLGTGELELSAVCNIEDFERLQSTGDLNLATANKIGDLKFEDIVLG